MNAKARSKDFAAIKLNGDLDAQKVGVVRPGGAFGRSGACCAAGHKPENEACEMTPGNEH